MLTWIANLIMNSRHNQRDDKICITAITLFFDAVIVFFMVWILFRMIGWL